MLNETEKELLQFLDVPRTRKEIVQFLGLNSATYAMNTYVNPLVERGLITLSIPEKPTSQKQLFVRTGAQGKNDPDRLHLTRAAMGNYKVAET